MRTKRRHRSRHRALHHLRRVSAVARVAPSGSHLFNMPRYGKRQHAYALGPGGRKLVGACGKRCARRHNVVHKQYVPAANAFNGSGAENNRIPRFVQGDNVNWQSSDLYVYDGSYLRLKNIQLGYTLPAALTQKVFISSLRFYVAAENLFTFTKYHGFDPEISSGGTSLGIDYGVYPQARVWTIGASLSF